MPKNITACVKVTPAEEEYLIGLGGTKSKGLRVILNGQNIGADATARLAKALDVPAELLTRGAGYADAAARAVPAPELEQALVTEHAGHLEVPVETVDLVPASMRGAVAFEDDDPKPHRHRRGELIRTYYEAGVEHKVHRCQHCDKEMG